MRLPALSFLVLIFCLYLGNCEEFAGDVDVENPVMEDTEKEVPDETETQENPELIRVLTDEEEQKFAEMKSHTEQSGYQAEVFQVMNIIVNSLYRNKDVFLRELLSNSFDALDKARYWGLHNMELFNQNPELSIRIKVDPVNHRLEITDTGIGMTKEELISNLGTIARSGTREFIKKLKQENQSSADLSNQIGQFGVGFYSVFLVSDRIIVVSKSVNDSKQHVFEADTSGFSVYQDPRGDTLDRGTSVILYLNQDSHEFSDEEKIIDLIRKYSEFLAFPIYVYSRTDFEGKPVDLHWKHVNDIAPLWMRSPSNITEEEYNNFYNAITYGRKKERYTKPIDVIHFSAEGSTNFVCLLFIPDRLDEAFVNNPMAYKGKTRLYVRRVLVSDQVEALTPNYLSYMPGIIDSDDFQLNVGREMTQHSELYTVLNKKRTRKILDHLKKMSQNDPDKYNRFYEEFGNTLKFGILEDEANSNRIARLLRFYSSSHKKNYTTLDDYVSRMKPGQPGIFFIPANSIQDADKSPYLQRFRHKGYEVLYLTSPIDEAVMQSLRLFDNKALYNVAKEISDIPQTETDQNKLKEQEAEMKPLTTWLKKKYFKGRVASVRVSDRLLQSSCILVAPEQGYSGSMERLIRSQSHIQGKSSSYDAVINQPKNLELNPFHPLVKSMLSLSIEDQESPELKDEAEMCYAIATLSGGYSINDGIELAGLIERLYLKREGLSPEDVSQQIHDELGIEEEEVDDKESEDKVSNDDDSDYASNEPSDSALDDSSEIPQEDSSEDQHDESTHEEL